MVDRWMQRVAILGMLGIVAFTAYRVVHAKPATLSGYAVGQRIDVPRIGTHRSVIVFARRTCQACQQALPILREIVAKSKVTLMTVDKFEGLRVRAVPTTVIVDEVGTILYTHEGVPAASDVAAMESVLKK